MKQAICLTGAFLIIGLLYGQTPTLFISTTKTSSLVFPFSIKHVDRGTKDVLVQPVKELDNVLLVKAGREDFTETNLSVLTADGSVYSFPVQYNSDPVKMVYQLPVQLRANASTYAACILDNPRTLHGIQREVLGITGKIIGIYTKDNLLFYQLEVDNASTIDFPIDFIRFSIRDKAVGKRTAVQEKELSTVCSVGNTEKVKEGARNVMVFAFDQFTLAKRKYLAITVNEKNGGRNLMLKVTNHKIVQARLLPDMASSAYSHIPGE